jgi:integrase
MTVADLTAGDLLARMTAGERAAMYAALARQDVRDKSYLELPMGREVGRYLNAKRKELTRASYIGYESCLEKLARRFADLRLEDFELPAGADLIEPWMDERWGDASPGTYNVNHSIIKDFFDWQITRQRMTSNPMKLVGRARKRDIYRPTFTDDQRHAIIASADSLRDRIALRLLFDYGIRKGALRAIQFKHFDYQRRRLTIFTKGSKVRELPIPSPAFWTDLERHILEVEARPNHYLMALAKPIPRAGIRRFPDRAMSNTATQRWWYARLNDAGLVAKGTTGSRRTMNMHAARHTAGQRVLDSTKGNLKAVQKLLGHASIQTTADTYTDWDIDQLAATLADVLEEDE